MRNREFLGIYSGGFKVSWVKFEEIDSLMKLIYSKNPCPSYVHPLSSYIPPGTAELGGYAALLVNMYRTGNPPKGYGLYLVPKVDTTLNKELELWWEEEKIKIKNE